MTSDASTRGDDLRIEREGDDDVIVLPDADELRRDRVIDLRDPEPEAPEAEDRRRRTYIWLLVTVCVLNSIDAILTRFVVSEGMAVEGNPIVASMGLLPKLILVPIAAEIVYLLKPKALWVPAVALFGVIVYTAVGLLLSA